MCYEGEGIKKGGGALRGLQLGRARLSFWYSSRGKYWRKGEPFELKRREIDQGREEALAGEYEKDFQKG